MSFPIHSILGPACGSTWNLICLKKMQDVEKALNPFENGLSESIKEIFPVFTFVTTGILSSYCIVNGVGDLFIRNASKKKACIEIITGLALLLIIDQTNNANKKLKAVSLLTMIPAGLVMTYWNSRSIQRQNQPLFGGDYV